MRRFARALVHALAVLASSFLISFFLLHALPGDPAGMRESTAIPVEVLEKNRRALGLDDSPPAQLLHTLTSYAHGDLGVSLGLRRPVRDVLREALPATALLGAAAVALSYGLGLPGALLLLLIPAPMRRLLDSLALVLASLPRFWLGVVLILVLHGVLGWLPASHAISPGGGGFGDVVRHLVMPALTLGLPGAAVVARYVLASLEETLRSPFVRAARATGAGGGRLLTRHLLRHAIGPAVSLLSLDIPVIVSGVVVVEMVFAWPGIGHLVADAVLGSDYPLALASAMLTAVAVVSGRLVAELVAGWIDPRQQEDGWGEGTA